MKKNWQLILIMAVILALTSFMLSACGGGEKAVPTPKITPTPISTPPPTATPEKPGAYVKNIHPADDAFVIENYERNTTSNESFLMVGLSGLPVDLIEHISYLKFNLDNIPPEAKITKATFFIYEYFEGAIFSDSVEPVEITLFSVEDDNWSESNINWFNKPASGEVLLKFFSKEEWNSFDITAFAKNQFAEDKNVSLALRMTDPITKEPKEEYWVKYWSNEKENAPKQPYDESNEILQPYLEIIFEIK